MLATLVIVFREVIEAGLIIGIVLAATRGVPYRSLWVNYGIIAGILGACVVAAFAGSISAAMEGMGQEMFNVTVLLAAVAMLTWHNVWMARHGREIALHMKGVGEAVAHGKRSLMALAIVVGLAVLREGSEVVLFLYGIALSGSDSATMMLLGGALGLAFGVAVGALTYLGLLKIPNRHLFAVTGWLIALLAAGMAAQAAVFLQQAQVIDALTETVWDSSWLISSGSIAGSLLHTLIGYTDRPNQLQLIVYVGTLAMIFSLMRLFGHTPKPPKAVMAASVIAIASIFLSGGDAHALDVKSPYVEHGMFEIESKNRVDFDNDPEKDRFRQHVIGVGYGITDWWSAELEGEWEKEPSQGYSFNATEIENIFQLTDTGQYWLDAGLQISYEFSHETAHPDKAEIFALLAKQLTHSTHIANIGLEQETGDNKNHNPELAAKWQSRYNYMPMINPGFEYYADFGELSDPSDYKDQKHRLGPVLFGSLGHGVSYELGWLFGLSKATEDHAIKFNLEYEFPVQF